MITKTYINLERLREERISLDKHDKKLYGNSPILFEGELIIPKISREKLKNLYASIKPIVTYKDSKYELRKFSLEDLKTKSYIWYKEKDLVNEVDLDHLYESDVFICLHKNDLGIFSPTIAEVLSQVPNNLIERINSFEIVEYPKTTRDIEMYPEANEKGYYLSLVQTYMKI